MGITMLLYALMNPIGVIAIFLGLTQRTQNIKAHRIIILASIAVAVFLSCSVLLGKQKDIVSSQPTLCTPSGQGGESYRF